jgi:hypothetical protein
MKKFNIAILCAMALTVSVHGTQRARASTASFFTNSRNAAPAPASKAALAVSAAQSLAATTSNKTKLTVGAGSANGTINMAGEGSTRGTDISSGTVNAGERKVFSSGLTGSNLKIAMGSDPEKTAASSTVTSDTNSNVSLKLLGGGAGASGGKSGNGSNASAPGRSSDASANGRSSDAATYISPSALAASAAGATPASTAASNGGVGGVGQVGLSGGAGLAGAIGGAGAAGAAGGAAGLNENTAVVGNVALTNRMMTQGGSIFTGNTNGSIDAREFIGSGSLTS